MYPFRSIYFDDVPQTGRILDVFEAEGTPREVALFFVHGGGWSGGTRTLFHGIMREYARRGFDCGSTDYRLKQGNVFLQIEDVLDGLELFGEDLSAQGRSPDVVMIGSSAGAHLALMAALGLRPTSPEVVGVAVQAAPFTLEPWDDIFPTIWGGMKRAVGVPYEGNEDLYRKASPTHQLRPGLPPVFALQAQNEHMFPPSLYDEFAARSTALGNDVRAKTYPAVEHGFFYSLDRWQQREAFEDILEFAVKLAPRRAVATNGSSH